MAFDNGRVQGQENRIWLHPHVMVGLYYVVFRGKFQVSSSAASPLA
jgi:hypothetical protein